MSDKNAYQEKIQARMDEWKADIDRLKAQVAQRQADARIEYMKKIEELEKQYLDAQSKLADLKDRGQEAWEEMRSGVDNAISELGHSFQKVKDHFQSR